MAKPQPLAGAAGGVPAVVRQTVERPPGAPVLFVKRLGEAGGGQIELASALGGLEGVRLLLGAHDPGAVMDVEITIPPRPSDRAIAAMRTCGELKEVWARTLEKALAPGSTERPLAGPSRP